MNQHISNMEFNSNTYQSVFEAADKVYLSGKNVSSVAALSTAQKFEETENEFSPLNTAFREEVAAVTTKNKTPKKPKKNKNKNQNGDQNQNQGSLDILPS